MTDKLNKPPIPGLLWGLYPEREKPQQKNGLLKHVPVINQYLNNNIKNKASKLIKEVQEQSAYTPAFNSAVYQQQLYSLQASLRRDGFTDQHISKAFCLISEAYVKVMQIHLFDSQLYAAYYMLNNRLAEMATGEGKTYAVALAAAIAGLCGVPVHVMTANNYLAKRDADKNRPLFEALGLTVDAAIEGQNATSRKKTYTADITYCTAKELVFDYLRDKTMLRSKKNTWQINPPDTLLPGLCMAIIDEADSILIDEASVPLKLSEATDMQQQEAYYKQSLSIASQLELNIDYLLDQDKMQAVLLDNGCSKLASMALTLPAVWHNKLHREESVSTALSALHLYKRDRHYIIHNNQISIIDITTGRVAEGRAWSGGLHQLIELKEGLTLSKNLSTVAQITFQRFFPKYVKLGGISGSLIESRSELQKTFGLGVNVVPLRIPSKRQTLPMRIYKCTHSRNVALINHVKQVTQTGRPILVATGSVEESEQLSLAMKQSKLTHNILNAKHDQQEAQLISQAGMESAITITTNMAGRGTDISISEAVNQLGGLHVISCQVNGSKRIDRQLIGRTARHGQRGSAEIWLSLDNKLIQKWLPNTLIKAYTNLVKRSPNSINRLLLLYVQLMEERHQIALRKRLLKSDQAIEKNLSFGG